MHNMKMPLTVMLFLIALDLFSQNDKNYAWYLELVLKNDTCRQTTKFSNKLFYKVLGLV